MAQPAASATGRRKRSVARVRLYDGDGKFVINGSKGLEQYFPSDAERLRVTEPLRSTGFDNSYDVHANLEGGGTTGQSDALRLGVARALVEVHPELRTSLKGDGMLTRDSRVVERKKYGLRKARRAPQYTKR